jgi:hypothetical protein
MGSARRAGRVQQIAYDATPLNAAQVDIDARIGWMLAMSRLHHPDPTFGDGRAFAAALAGAGFPASRSLISRWESGEIPISYEGMSAYERALGLEEGRLSSLTGYIRSAIPGVRTRVVRPQLDVSGDDFSRRLDDLLDLAEDGEALATDWQDLGWYLAAVPHVHLRRATWENLCHQVVNLLPRAIRVPYRQYSTASMNLATIPRAQDYLVEAIDDHLSDPDVQVIMNPMGLLDQLPTREAARIVLDKIETPPTASAFRLAVWLAAQKMSRGDFSSDERSRLDMLVLKLWRQNPAKASEDLAELIAGLPEGLRSTLTSAADRAGRRKLGYVVEHGEEMVASQARALARELAEQARAGVPQPPAYAEDRMLPRLLRESLFHRDSERRHLASLLISASPFGDAVTDALLQLLDGGRERVSPWVRARAATTVRYLGSDLHRMRMLKHIEDPDPDVVTVIAQGLGHLSYNRFSDQVLRASLRQTYSTVERAKMYALGMSGSPVLPMLLKAPRTPAWQQSAARWWLAKGAAIRA